jgi:2,3-bisphosphoglycerate-independent phosphoglycerate mutase
MTPRVLFLFIDGIGLGDDEPGHNPFAVERWSGLEAFAGRRLLRDEPCLDKANVVFRGIDATLGLPGLPQSGTGQATIFTGANCAAAAGRHFGPFPHSATRSLLAERNLFRQAQQALDNADAALFANGYPRRFLAYLETTTRYTVTTRCCTDAGMRIRDAEDIREGRAIPADITGELWPDNDIEPTSVEEAARTLLHLTAAYPLTVFEFFHSDKAGHAMDMSQALRVLRTLDEFLAALMIEADEGLTIVMTSDHGNLEDLRTKSHTLNQVPLVARGPCARHFGAIDDLTQITPAILSVLTSTN